MNHIGTVEIESERLLLRPFVLDDAKDMYENWATDEIVTKYLPWKPHDSVDLTEEIVQMWIDSYEEEQNYHWAMVIKETGELIGSIGTVDINDNLDKVEIGYCTSQSSWGKGYGTEALNLMYEFLFNKVGIRVIYAKHHSENEASGNLIKKIGMTFVKEIEVNCAVQGTHESMVYKITKDEWNK